MDPNTGLLDCQIQLLCYLTLSLWLLLKQCKNVRSFHLCFLSPTPDREPLSIWSSRFLIRGTQFLRLQPVLCFRPQPGRIKTIFLFPPNSVSIISCLWWACVQGKLFSNIWLFATLWTIAHQVPLSIGFSKQEYWSGLPCPPPRDLPAPGSNLISYIYLYWQVGSLLLGPVVKGWEAPWWAEKAKILEEQGWWYPRSQVSPWNRPPSVNPWLRMGKNSKASHTKVKTDLFRAMHIP